MLLFSARYTRSTSVPPVLRSRYSASPFRDRATSTPPTSRYSSLPTSTSHYTDFDYKVINYVAKLYRQDEVKQYVSSRKTTRFEKISFCNFLTWCSEKDHTQLTVSEVGTTFTMKKSMTMIIFTQWTTRYNNILEALNFNRWYRDLNLVFRFWEIGSTTI